MALSALIAASKEVDGSLPGLRATLPVAGQCLVEHQARLAARAGARHIVILVGALPPPLMAAIDRLRGDGLGVEIARTLADAVDRIHPEESLLVFADGLVTGTALVERIGALDGPAIVTVPDEPAAIGFERIDAADRWAGLLLIDGTRLRRTAEMLGEWDLGSTLLRHAVQEGVPRVRIDPQDHAVVADGAAALAGIDAALFAASRAGGRDWPSAWIFPAIERLAAPPLIARGIDAAIPGWAAAGLAGIGGLAMLGGWWLTGFALLLLSGPVAAVAWRIGAARLAAPRIERVVARVRLGGAAVGLLGLTWGLAGEQGWGVWAVAALLALAMAATAGERTIVARLPGRAPSRWLATLDGLLWAGIPFALFGEWGKGLFALACYAIVTFFLVQREVRTRLAER